MPEEEATEIHAAEPSESPPDTTFHAPKSQLHWSPPGLDQSSRSPLPRPFDRGHDLARKFATPIPVVDSANADPNPPDPWATIDSRALLEHWLSASGTPKQQIERELQRRGFGSLRSDVVRLAMSDDTAGRIQLVQDLLATTAVGAKGWLMLLADDADAEVRLSAVTVMATSNDGQLLEKAWQVALHDRDPRIASLAERLRDRRASAHRR